MSYVIDTDIAIDYLKGKADVVEAVESFPGFLITSITAAELFYGAYKSDYPEKNEDRVIKFLGSLTILDVDFYASRLFGKIKADLKRKGKMVGDFDLLIAGTCIIQECTLITRNMRHYKDITGLRVESI